MADKAGPQDREAAQRFRAAALPYLDDVYTLARFLLRNATNADDAVQECYLRALAHFDTYRGPEIKPWLFAILRNVCNAQHAQRRTAVTVDGDAADDEQDCDPVWQEPQQSPEAQVLRRHDRDTVRRLITELPEPFRRTLVLRDLEDLSYRQIADLAAVPIGTVMSRLARARAMLRAAWLVAQNERPQS